MDLDKFVYEIGMRIKKIKEDKGLSYSDIEAESSLDRSVIAKICNGDQNITVKTLFRLAHALGVDPKELLP